MDIKISQLTALSLVELEGTEFTILQRGNENYRVSTDVLAEYALQKERIPIEITMDGTIGQGVVGYVDLFTPNDTQDIDKVVLVVKNTTSATDAATLGVVLSDGNPVNDVEVFPQNSIAELNSTIKYAYEVGAQDIPSGFSFKLKIEDENITAGTVKTIIYFIP